MYVLWDIIDDTIKRKANASDASAFADICGCFPSQGMSSPILSLWCTQRLTGTPRAIVWGVIWLVQALIMFAAAIIIGLVAFKVCCVYRGSSTRTIIDECLATAIGEPTSLGCAPRVARTRRAELRDGTGSTSRNDGCRAASCHVGLGRVVVTTAGWSGDT